MTTELTVIATPIGPLRLHAADGHLTAIRFLAAGEPEPAHRDSALLNEARRQLSAYFRGTLQRFDLPLRPAGTDFQRQVWKALEDIPWGETRSYLEIARALGRPRAVRAVGAANGANLLPVVIPCHRVIGASGRMTGYAGGLERKRRLLAVEGIAARD